MNGSEPYTPSRETVTPAPERSIGGAVFPFTPALSHRIGAGESSYVSRSIPPLWKLRKADLAAADLPGYVFSHSHAQQVLRQTKLRRSCCFQGSGTGVPPVRIVQPTHGRDARATTVRKPDSWDERLSTYPSDCTNPWRITPAAQEVSSHSYDRPSQNH